MFDELSLIIQNLKRLFLSVGKGFWNILHILPGCAFYHAALVATLVPFQGHRRKEQADLQASRQNDASTSCL